MNANLTKTLLIGLLCAGLGGFGPALAKNDRDGVPHERDHCPDNTVTPTVVLGACDSGVPNAILPDGCTIADRIASCEGAGNHGRFVSCVAHVTNQLKKEGLISCSEKGRIQSCAAQPAPNVCRIRGSFHSAGALNPENPCQACRPEISARQWSTAADGTICDDGDVCTADDACSAGACAGGPPPDCSDLDICTVDSCDPASGCVNTYVGDGNACDMWVTDGAVDATALHGDILYISGRFNWVSPQAVGAFVPFDDETAELSREFPKVVGPVLAAVPDGAGGWYIGGTFYRVGDVERAGLAHILADGTVADWDPCAAPNFCLQDPGHLGVNDLALHDGVVYVAGAEFVGSDGLARYGVAAIDAQTGQFTAWNPDTVNLIDPPSVLLVSGNTLFAGTRFVGGPGTSLLAIDIATAEVTGSKETEGQPNYPGPINDLALRGNTLYVGGAFTTIGGEAREGLAAIDVSSWLVTPWNPEVIGGPDPGLYRVSELVVSGDTLYVGGNFDAIAGQARNGLAAIDADTGQVTGWDPNAWNPGNDLTTAFAVEGGKVYAARTQGNPGSSAYEVLLFAIDATTGAVLEWDPALHPGPFGSAVDLIAAEPDTVWVGGSGSFNFGGVERNGLAAFDVRTGRPTDWPNADCFPSGRWGALDLAATDDAVYLGGVYIVKDLQVENGVFALDPSSLSANCVHWTHSFHSSYAARTIAVGGDVVYVGGNLLPSGAVALDAEDGTITSWDPGLGQNGTRFVYDIEVAGQTVYLGGRFTSAHGEPRNHLAAVDAVTGLPTPWDPNPNTPATSVSGFGLEVDGGLVYVVGSHFTTFSTIGGQPRNGLASVDAVTGLASPWNPEVLFSRTVDFSISDGIVYLGYRAVDTVTGAVASWDPFAVGNPLGNPGFLPGTLEAGGGVVFIGSDPNSYYGVVGGELRSGIAAVAGVSSAGARASEEEKGSR